MKLEHVAKLLELMESLRDPNTGSSWDQQQNFESIVSHTIEEAYEVADAIAKQDANAIQDEVSDLLFQVVYYAQFGKEKDWFDFDTLAKNLCDKLHRRHIHLTDPNSKDKPPNEVEDFWNQCKSKEHKDNNHVSLLDNIPLALPALSRAQKLQKRAASQGFDWPDKLPVIDKLQEELEELKHALLSNEKESCFEELGDMIFTCVNLARHLDFDAETLLRSANRKFEKRFKALERRVDASSKPMNEMSLEELDAVWNEVKTHT